MKNKTLLLLTFLSCNLLIISAQKINVATYNIRNDNQGDVINGNGWKQRCPVICQLIQFHEFDIFGSQEVKKNQLDDMLNAMPEYGYVGVGRDDGKDKGEYSPIFYNKNKFKLLDAGHFWMSQITDRPNKGWDAALPRICSWGKFQMNDGGKSFWLFNLHMDHIGVVARSESAKLVLDRIKTMCGKNPVILMGDFNVDQFNEAYLLLNSSGIMKDVYDTSGLKYALNGTFNNFDPNLTTDKRIDHIFVSKQFKALRYGVLTDTYRSDIKQDSLIRSNNFPKEVSLLSSQARMPSDHFPVLTTLEFVGGTR
ncbi:MAG: endonuclease/exonuclease/phosphatase family protein [Paludibacter sp.]|nr:endonuclease/exonuclease/phosphatase family protein [Paludibacter sp.]